MCLPGVQPASPLYLYSIFIWKWIKNKFCGLRSHLEFTCQIEWMLHTRKGHDCLFASFPWEDLNWDFFFQSCTWNKPFLNALSPNNQNCNLELSNDLSKPILTDFTVSIFKKKKNQINHILQRQKWLKLGTDCFVKMTIELRSPSPRLWTKCRLPFCFLLCLEHLWKLLTSNEAV